MQRIRLDRSLTRMAISDAVGEVEEALGRMQAQRKSAIKTQLELEEVLISYLERFGEGGRFDVSCFRRFGKIHVRVAYEGNPFNPIEEVSESAALLMRLVAMEDLSPRWDWLNGVNTIEFPVESAHPSVSLTVLMLYALGAAAVLGFAALGLPSGVRDHLVGFADPTFGLLLEIIKGVAGPFIFLTIVGSVCAIGDVGAFGRAGLRLAGAIALMFVTACAAGVAVARVFTAPGTAAVAAGGIGGLSEFLVKLVPVNLFSPFVEGNIPQILVLAIVLGLTLLAQGGRVTTAVRICEDLKAIMSEVMNLVLRYFLPPMVFMCIFSMIASGRMAMLLGSWKVAALTVGTVAGYVSVVFAFTCVRFGVSPRTLFRDVFPAALIGFTTSSPLAGLPQELQTLKKQFGVNADFADFASSLVLPVTSFGYYTELAVMMVCMAGFYGLAMPLSWLVSAVLLVAIAGLSTPPFPGTAGIVMGLLLTQLGIPAACVGLLIAIDMAVDYASCFGNAILRLCIIRNVAASVSLVKEKGKG